MENGRFILGVVSTLAGAAFWGLSGSCVEYLALHTDLSPWLLPAVRMFGAAVLFMLFVAARHRDDLSRIVRSSSDMKRVAVFGMGLFACQLTYIMSINFLNAGTATVLQGLNVIMILFYVCIVARRPPYAMEIAGIVLAMAATVLIATKGDLGTLALPLAGLIWGFACAASAAFYTVYPRRLLEEYPSPVVTGLGMCFGFVLASLVWIVFGAFGVGGASHALPHLDAMSIWIIVLIIVGGTFASFGLFLHGVSIVGSVTGGLLGMMEPLSATVISAVWLHTAFTWADWAGLVLMSAMIVLVTLQKSPNRSGTAVAPKSNRARNEDRT